jgi:hypothetical protein
MGQVKRKARQSATPIEDADRKVARATGGKRNTMWMKALGQVSELADQPPLMTISAVTIAAGVCLRDKRVLRTGVRMFASHWLATKAKSFIKHRLDRTRPFVMLGGGNYHARGGHSHAKGENSFPSGHTAGAVAIARAVACDYPATAPIGYAAAGAAAHYLSDVVIGAAIGWLAEAAVRLILSRAPDAVQPPPSADRPIVDAEAVIAGGQRRQLPGDSAPALDSFHIAGDCERPNPLGDMGGRSIAIYPLDRERFCQTDSVR